MCEHLIEHTASWPHTALGWSQPQAGTDDPWGELASELRGALADATGDTPAMRRSTDGILVESRGSLPVPTSSSS